ncbi:MAG: TlpA family protein disulfide reductase [Actinobacteria bacterium]|nr:TlpA family protein disulfide reductase [Actinomycetota bacterium]
MTRSKLSLISVVVSALLLSGCAGGGSSSTAENFVAGNGVVTFIKPAERKPAPVISGKTLEGATYLQPRGKVVILNVWASWCAPCRAEAPALVSLSQMYPEVSFVGVLIRDNFSTARAFVKRFKVTYPTLVDESILIKFRNTLVANAIPTTLIIDANGKVAARISGEITVASLTDLINKIKAGK